MDVSGSSSSTVKKDKGPVAIITIGMAGAGKTTFVQRINAYLHSLSPASPPYILNLDPAVTRVPYEANIDIRDTVNYQEVMKQFVSDPFFFFSFPILVDLDESSPMKGII
jgi:GTPase SAR1 family protein